MLGCQDGLLLSKSMTTIKYCRESENKIADILSQYPPVIEETFASKNIGSPNISSEVAIF